MSCGGSQPAGLCGLRKQVIEAKEGPLELRRQKVKVPTRLKRRKGGERPWRALESKRERVMHHLTMRMCSEKCIIKRFCHYANIIE